MCKIAAEQLSCDAFELEFRGDGVCSLDGSKFMSRKNIATKSMAGN